MGCVGAFVSDGWRDFRIDDLEVGFLDIHDKGLSRKTHFFPTP